MKIYLVSIIILIISLGIYFFSDSFTSKDDIAIREFNPDLLVSNTLDYKLSVSEFDFTLTDNKIAISNDNGEIFLNFGNRPEETKELFLKKWNIVSGIMLPTDCNYVVIKVDLNQNIKKNSKLEFNDFKCEN